MNDIEYAASHFANLTDEVNVIGGLSNCGIGNATCDF